MNKKLVQIIFAVILCIQNSYAAEKLSPAPPPDPEEAPYPSEDIESTKSNCKTIDGCIVVLPSKKYEEQYLLMKQLAPNFTDLVSILKTTEPTFLIETRECHVVNSWYSPVKKRITLCYEYLSDGDKFIENSYSNQSPEIQATLQTGIFFQVLIHEFAHAAIDIKHIPVLGNEEDAADKIATIILLSTGKNNPSIAKLAIVGSIAYWNAKATGYLEKTFLGENLFADEHPLNEQRMFNMVCLAYGSNPSMYLDVAKNVGLPQERASRCEGEYIKAKAAISDLLK